MQKPRCHSVQIPEILQVDGFVVFCERGLVPETELLAVGEVRPKFRDAVLVERQL
jgi:hypothetical protein